MRTHRSSWMSFVLLMAWLPTWGFGGGSYPVEWLMPLFLQDPVIHSFVTSTLDLDDSAWARRIGSNVNEDLGGARLAPYTILAKPKGSTGPWVFQLILEADAVFLDAQGQPVPLEKGKKIKETLKGIQMISIPESDRP